jgi:hypothetical protein
MSSLWTLGVDHLLPVKKKCLECAFDQKQITLIQGDTTSNFKLKGTQSTFASLEGHPLQTNQERHLTYRWLLAHHALLSYRNARKQQWLEESDDVTHKEYRRRT